jgi:tight adherence protein B
VDAALLIAAGLGLVAGLAIWAALARLTAPQEGAQTTDIAPDGPGPVGATTGRARPSWARMAATAVAGAGVWALTGWPVAAAGAAALAWFAPTVVGGEASFKREQAKADAVAAWAESLRDVIGAAAGLGQAIQRSAEHPPPAIRAEVCALALDLRSGIDLETSLRAFANRLNDETGDLVAMALIGAASGSGNVAPVLDDLARTARAEAAMRQRIHTGRARTRTATRVICATTVVMLLFMILVAGDYLASYDSFTGQVVLACALGLFAAGLWGMHRLATPKPALSFLRADDAGAPS